MQEFHFVLTLKNGDWDLCQVLYEIRCWKEWLSFKLLLLGHVGWLVKSRSDGFHVWAELEVELLKDAAQVPSYIGLFNQVFCFFVVPIDIWIVILVEQRFLLLIFWLGGADLNSLESIFLHGFVPVEQVHEIASTKLLLISFDISLKSVL